MTALRICFVGDSTVNGAGDPDSLGWVGRLCAAEQGAGHDLTLYNLGVRGDTSGDILARWEGEAARRLPPEHDGRVIFSFGINDVALAYGRRRIPLELSLRNVRAILGAARARYPTLMISPPPVTDFDEQRRLVTLARAFAEVCAELAVPYLDVLHPLAAGHVWRREGAARDGYHPRAAGYAAFADLVRAWPAWRAWIDGGGPR